MYHVIKSGYVVQDVDIFEYKDYSKTQIEILYRPRRISSKGRPYHVMAVRF